MNILNPTHLILLCAFSLAPATVRAADASLSEPARLTKAYLHTLNVLDKARTSVRLQGKDELGLPDKRGEDASAPLLRAAQEQIQKAQPELAPFTQSSEEAIRSGAQMMLSTMRQISTKNEI